MSAPKPTEPADETRDTSDTRELSDTPDTPVPESRVQEDGEALDDVLEDARPEGPGLLVRLPWILFQGLVIGLPLGGLVIYGTWVLRLFGVALPWPPSVGLALGVLSGMVSLAAFQTLGHEADQAAAAEEENHDEDQAGPEIGEGSRVDRKPEPSLLARVTAGVILGSLIGVPTAVAVLVVGAAVGYFWIGLSRMMPPTGVAAGVCLYIALALGIKSALRR